MGQKRGKHIQHGVAWYVITSNLKTILRTVPTFVIAHMFCASRKPWLKRARAGVDIDAINYATKLTTKIKAKFSYGDQINFNEPVLRPGRPE